MTFLPKDVKPGDLLVESNVGRSQYCLSYLVTKVGTVYIDEVALEYVCLWDLTVGAGHFSRHHYTHYQCE